jgi:hypothetical protein
MVPRSSLSFLSTLLHEGVFTLSLESIQRRDSSVETMKTLLAES